MGQHVKTKTPLIDEAFTLAVKTLRDNIEEDLIKAGGGYGGEWTLDCAINSWNAASLLEPQAAEHSLWSVAVDDRGLIGHQYGIITS